MEIIKLIMIFAGIALITLILWILHIIVFIYMFKKTIKNLMQCSCEREIVEIFDTQFQTLYTFAITRSDYDDIEKLRIKMQEHVKFLNSKEHA